MNQILRITWMLSLVPGGADKSDLEVYTVSGGVLGETPFQLRKAIIAAHCGDKERVRRLGCIVTAEGVKAALINQRMPFAGPWQVQLMMEDRLASRMLGYASSFAPPVTTAMRP
jgi:hypothetical protein